MFRNALVDLDSWIAKDKSKPLLIRGARQVGKSYLVRELAQRAGRDLIEVNLEITKIFELDNRETFSIEKVLEELALVANKKITQNSLVFIDEIQAQPQAVQSLRYFFEQRPDIKVVAAGSLFEVVSHQHNFSMPVGRIEYYHLGPLTFFEFLQALGQNELLRQIKNIHATNYPGPLLNRKAIEFLKKYYFLGGMPEVVQTFLDSESFDAARHVQRSLLQTYQDDIPKYAAKQGSNILDVFNYAVHNLGNRVVYSKINNKNTEYLKHAIKLLSLARVLHVCAHNSCNGMPLEAGVDRSIQKLYFLDVGLYNCLLGTTWQDLFTLTSDKLLTKGNIAEQFIAQHLVSLTPKQGFANLYYWLRNKQQGKAEVDFILSHNSEIFPVEVKAGASGAMRSLWRLLFEKNLLTAIRFDLSERKQASIQANHTIVTGDGTQTVEATLLFLPVYAVENLPSIMQTLSSHQG